MAGSKGYRGWIAACAAAALLAGTGAKVSAQDNTAPDAANSTPPLTPPTNSTPGWMQRNLIANTMFDDWGIKVSGYVEGGYSYNWDKPSSGSNGFGFLYIDRSEDARLDQLSLMAQRDPILSPQQFDLGFKAQAIFGADARFTQANGTNFYGSRYADDLNTQKIPLPHTEFFTSGSSIAVYVPGNIGPGQPLTSAGQTNPENQLDILQAALVMNLPAYNGVILTAGKFVTPWGMEKTDPTQNEFFSHSYIFGLATPKTLTGLMADAPVDKNLYVMGGVVVGWDQSLEDNNSFPSLMAQARYHMLEMDEDHPWDFAFTLMAGPEIPGNRSDWQWTLDVTGKTHATDDMDFGFEGVLGFEDDTGTHYRQAFKNLSFLVDVLEPSGDNAVWFGGALYGDWKLDPDRMYVLAGRMEAFSDDAGGRGLATTVYSLTADLNIFPCVHSDIGHDLMLRPEVRWDIADHKIFNDYDSGEQLSFNVDLTYKF